MSDFIFFELEIKKVDGGLGGYGMHLTLLKFHQDQKGGCIRKPCSSARDYAQENCQQQQHPATA
jgi:hypothetical protein